MRRAIHNQDEDQVQSVLRGSGANIGKALFAQKGLSVPPDATFTLRLSYGTIEGYKLNGKNVPWFTTMGGAYEHAAKHGNKPPYQLPESWMKYKSAIDLKTPFDTVSTPDIIGGNSGSPVINKAGEVVGIIFDGNIESLAWNFAYSDYGGSRGGSGLARHHGVAAQDLSRRCAGERAYRHGRPTDAKADQALAVEVRFEFTTKDT